MPHSSHPLQHRDSHLLLRCRRGAGSSPPSAGMASFAVATVPSLAAPATRKRSGGVTYVEGMNAYSGLKGLNKVTMLGLRKTADYSFAKIVASLSPSRQDAARQRVRGADERRGGDLQDRRHHERSRARRRRRRVRSAPSGGRRRGVRVGMDARPP